MPFRSIPDGSVEISSTGSGTVARLTFDQLPGDHYGSKFQATMDSATSRGFCTDCCRSARVLSRDRRQR